MAMDVEQRPSVSPPRLPVRKEGACEAPSTRLATTRKRLACLSQAPAGGVVNWFTRLLHKFRRDTVAISVCAYCGSFEGVQTWGFNGEAWCLSHTYCTKCLEDRYPEEEAA